MPAAKPRIAIHPTPDYLAEHSAPNEDRYVFAYTIRIENQGQAAAQLIARHGLITDAHQHVQEVRGLGVVGEQPCLAPGEAYEYTSACQIATPVGRMRGSYSFLAADGSSFEVEIPVFMLSMPRAALGDHSAAAAPIAAHKTKPARRPAFSLHRTLSAAVVGVDLHVIVRKIAGINRRFGRPTAEINAH